MENIEKELINKAKNKDSAAFSELYNLYFPKIYKFVYYRTNHKETAEDLTSKIFTKVLEKLSSFDNSQGYFNAWLYRIARNTLIDHYRSNKQTLDIELFDIDSNAENMEDKISNKQLLEKIQKNLLKLKPDQKEIITLRVWDQLSYKEISRLLDKSEASCKMSFSRAIKTLRTNLVAISIFITTLIIKNYG